MLNLSHLAVPRYPVAHHDAQPTVSRTCEHIADGRPSHTRCDLTSRHDITTWCFSCLRNYILDRRLGDGDCRAGDFDGSPESLDVIADAMRDLTNYGPAWYRERDDVEARAVAHEAAGGSWAMSGREVRELADGWRAGVDWGDYGEGCWDIFDGTGAP
jgi:hypothetical protein